MNKHSEEMIQKVRDLGLPDGDWAIFGSGPMVPHGLKEFDHDVDIIARGAAWEKAMTLGKVEQAPMRDHRVVLDSGHIEIFDGWAPGEWDKDELIDTAEVFDGIRYVTLENCLENKKRLSRNKDLPHIQLIHDHIKMIEDYIASAHVE